MHGCEGDIEGSGDSFERFGETGGCVNWIGAFGDDGDSSSFGEGLQVLGGSFSGFD